MPSDRVKAKFRKRGRRVLFARFAGVYPSAVTQWLNGAPSARLDRLARLPVREWVVAPERSTEAA